MDLTTGRVRAGLHRRWSTPPDHPTRGSAG
jgi:hypothetical protein